MLAQSTKTPSFTCTPDTPGSRSGDENGRARSVGEVGPRTLELRESTVGDGLGLDPLESCEVEQADVVGEHLVARVHLLRDPDELVTRSVGTSLGQPVLPLREEPRSAGVRVDHLPEHLEAPVRRIESDPGAELHPLLRGLAAVVEAA